MLQKTYSYLFLIGLFFLPFNSYEGIVAMGEFRSESAAIFLLLGFLVLIVNTIHTHKIVIPYKSHLFQIVMLFLIWSVLTTLFNFATVSTNYFKHTAGINRFVRQYAALLISSLLFFILYINVLARMGIKDVLFTLRKVILWSLVVASIYGFLEILISVFGYKFLYPVLKLFDYFPFLEVSLHPGGRISSVSYEPPFFAIYLITIAGWMFSYVLTSTQKTKFLPTIVVLILTYYSGSRTGLIVVFFQFLIFLIILYRDKRFKGYIINSVAIFAMILGILLVFKGQKIINSFTEKIDSLDFKKNLTKNVSNQSRFGMQYASLQVFLENPIIGVGFGQQTYHNRTHYPTWATRNNYEFELLYKNKKEKSFPPGYNIYTRLLAETGLVGIVLFLGLITLSFLEIKSLLKKAVGEERVLLIVILISLIGLYINWLQIDTFRMYGVWLSLAILIKIRYESNRLKNE